MKVLLTLVLALLFVAPAQAHIAVKDFTYYSLPVVFHGHGHRDMVEATPYGDELYGYGTWDRLLGMGGMDIIYGHGGPDFLLGNGSSDILVGGYGDDFLDGGAGEDWCTGGPGIDIYANCEHTN